MTIVHIDSDADEDMWMPVCGVRWAAVPPGSGHQDAVMGNDDCRYLSDYPNGRTLAKGETWCQACVDSPNLPLLLLNSTELQR